MTAARFNQSANSGKIVPIAAVGFAQVRDALVSASGDETIATRLAYIQEFEKAGNEALVTSFGFEGGDAATFVWPDRKTFERFLGSPEFTGRQSQEAGPDRAARG